MLPETNLEIFFNQLIQNKTNKLSDALDFLPTQYKSNFTLVHDSHSLHGSSTSAPRVISFGNTAQTIFTFNGEASQNAYEAMEIVDIQNNELQFREIIFKKDLAESSHYNNSKSTILESEIFYKDDNIQISKANPIKCMACHKSNSTSSKYEKLTSPRYLWNSYKLWPGVFGAFDDIVGSVVGDYTHFSPQILNDFLNFKKNRAKESERYKFLDFGEFEASPYHVYNGLNKVFTNESDINTFKSMPNTKLTRLLASNYTYIMAKKILNNKEFQKLSNLELHQWICSDINNKKYKSKKIDAILKSIGYTNNLNPLTRNLNYESLNADSFLWNTGVEDLIFTSVSLNSLFKSQILINKKLVTVNFNYEIKENFYKIENLSTQKHLINIGLVDFNNTPLDISPILKYCKPNSQL